jgi:hypothetical protein
MTFCGLSMFWPRGTTSTLPPFALPPRGTRAFGYCSRRLPIPGLEGYGLDRTPASLRAALERPLNTALFEVVIPGFVLQWDVSDLVSAMGKRRVLWTDPTNWMGKVIALKEPYQYRYVLGDTTDFSEAQDDAYIAEWLK